MQLHLFPHPNPSLTLFMPFSLPEMFFIPIPSPVPPKESLDYLYYLQLIENPPNCVS